MAFIEQFTDQERGLLVRLPYRAGLWMSRVDEEGGANATYREENALDHIIHRKASATYRSPFVHEVMKELVDSARYWKGWGENLDAVPDECRQAVRILNTRLARTDVDAYRNNIMAISVEVARAFREFDVDVAIPIRIWTFLRLMIDKIIGFFKGERYESEALLSISFEEDLALAKLAQALGEDVQNERLGTAY